MCSLLEKYRTFLPVFGDAPEGMGEGATPLVTNTRLLEGLQPGRLLLKMEQLNPTGSYKDRFAAVETAVMKHAGIKTCLATSSGNTGSALAAYSARLGIECFLFVNEITPVNKLKQMLVYGAKVYRVKDFGVSSEKSALIFDRLQEVAAEIGSRLVISAFKYSPEGMQGVKTISYEIVEQLGQVPDHVFVPVGGGGLLSGVWQGFVDLKERGLVNELPRMNVVQPELNNTIVDALRAGREQPDNIKTTTAISGLAVQIDIDGTRAMQAVRSSNGRGYVVTDEEIWSTQERLCRREGIYVEPAGAASVAGYLKAVEEGRISEKGTAVCVLTGHGLKDERSVEAGSVVQAIGLGDISTELFHG
jgi:threonine synthase